MKTRNGAAALLVVLCLVSFADAGAQERHPPRQITNDPAQEGFPAWSPDGKTIVFSRIAFREGPNLWVLEVSTGRLAKAFGEADLLPVPSCWSPDGRTIAFTSARSGNFDIWTIDVDVDAAHRELTGPEH